MSNAKPIKAEVKGRMILLAIDPGSECSAYVLWDGFTIHGHGKIGNHELMRLARDSTSILSDPDRCVIEMIASYGMPVGKEVFETCVWIGRFVERFGPDRCERIMRNTVKNHICHSSKAKDSNIRQALIDRFGRPGTKKAPGLLYGVKADIWAALAVAVTWFDLNGGGARK